MRSRLTRILLGCHPDEHLWRKLYGDERMHRGALYACEHCGRRTDGPVNYHIDPAQDQVDALKRQTGVDVAEISEWADGRLPSRPVPRKS